MTQGVAMSLAPSEHESKITSLVAKKSGIKSGRIYSNDYFFERGVTSFLDGPKQLPNLSTMAVTDYRDRE